MSSMRSASSSTSILTWRKSASLAGDQVLQASWGGDHQAPTRAQGLNLRVLRYAADDQRGFGHSLRAQLLILLVNLHGELARGQQHQRSRLA